MIKADLKQYTSYKANETNWSGEIPESWDVKRIKDFATVVRGGSPRPAGDPNLYDGSIPFLKVGDLTSDENVYLSTHTHTIKEAGLISTRMVPQNTLLLTNSGATLGIPKICTFETTFNDGIAAFTYLKNTNQVFLFYFLKSQTDWYLNQASLGQGQPNLNIEIIANTFIPCPSLEEQQAIADYLDAKTAQIDRKIELLEQKAEKYTDLKQSLINETVTRGLDKTVQMKDSGVEWIGQIPAHWEVRQFKQFATMKGRIGWQGLKSSEFTDEVNSPFLITGMNFKDGIIRWNEVYHISNERYEQAPEIQLKNNDILMTKDGTIGKLLFIENIPFPHKASLNSHLLVIRPIKNGYFPKFMFHQLNSLPFKHYTELAKSGTTFFGISQEATERYIAVLPPMEEQKAIAEYLDTKTAHIEQIIENINLQIETFKELRKTLINDVVTGKIKVYEETIHE